MATRSVALLSICVIFCLGAKPINPIML
jgi:hypothetical protein